MKYKILSILTAIMICITPIMETSISVSAAEKTEEEQGIFDATLDEGEEVPNEEQLELPKNSQEAPACVEDPDPSKDDY